jgi:adenylate cyclase
VALLNEYFTIMVDCIQHFGGMLDKFIGDAFMAGFGMPISGHEDEDNAVRAAISMSSQLNEWNIKRLKQNKKRVLIGIGLNTDIVVSGNIGSPKRMDYTMIGDGVNLASRLESACKHYHSQILISEYTYNKLRGSYRIREIDRVIVKGKTEPVGVFEVLDYHTEETFPNMMKILHYFQEGLNEYRQRNWDYAIEIFNNILTLHDTDNVSHLYIERCKHLQTHPPDDNWTGVWVMESK